MNRVLSSWQVLPSLELEAIIISLPPVQVEVQACLSRLLLFRAYKTIESQLQLGKIESVAIMPALHLNYWITSYSD